MNAHAQGFACLSPDFLPIRAQCTTLLNELEKRALNGASVRVFARGREDTAKAAD